MPGELGTQLNNIEPSVDGDMCYYPCSVTLKNKETINCVYLVDRGEYLKHWGVLPADDEGKWEVLLADVIKIEESPFRLPNDIANIIYGAGESGMGYCVFTLKFDDGSKQAYISGNAVDFVEYPANKGGANVKSVAPHEGRNSFPKNTPKYSWCLINA